MKRRTRGWSLLEAMVAIAILGIAAAAASSPYRALDGPGSPGLRAERSLAAVDALDSAHQASLLDWAPPGETTLPSHDPDIHVVRTIEAIEPNVQRITFVASWRDGPRTRTRRLVTLKLTP